MPPENLGIMISPLHYWILFEQHSFCLRFKAKSLLDSIITPYSDFPCRKVSCECIHMGTPCAQITQFGHNLVQNTALPYAFLQKCERLIVLVLGWGFVVLNVLVECCWNKHKHTLSQNTQLSSKLSKVLLLLL